MATIPKRNFTLFEGVRRSKRKRTVNMTWLADSQMHKVGYPNINAGYSEEDSRDAADERRENIEIVRRVTRRSNGMNNSNYLYDYEESELPPRCRRSETLRNKSDIRPSTGELNDKENKKEAVNGKIKNLKFEGDVKNKDGVNENGNEFDRGIGKTPESNTEEATNGDGGLLEKRKLKPGQEQTSESEEVIPLTRLRTSTIRNKERARQANFPPRNEKRLDSSSESEEEGRKYSLRDRVPKPAPKTMQTSVLRTRDLRTRRHFTRRRARTVSSSSSSDSLLRRQTRVTVT
ncbi:hypothetical protein NQ318_010015 [Aromia moschata]|uniref:Uncharacterized protein n=1 Tax=Aromia moschata TaxID=1265417 RepID=A0AAV8YA65_9CUCU|nr:hypothetical protein NQ318_010015 [Aromia moschata]